MLVKKWLVKYGGDPRQYKKQTRAFDALAALADRLVREHVSTILPNSVNINSMSYMESEFWETYPERCNLGIFENKPILKCIKGPATHLAPAPLVRIIPLVYFF